MKQLTCALLVSLIPAGALAAPPGSLVEAVRNRDASATRALLTRGGDVNGMEADGTTPLHWAAHYGDTATVEALIAAGARVNATNRYGVAPLWLAATNGYAAVVGFLLRHGAAAETVRADSGETVLMIAAQGGHVTVLQHLLARGANPNAKDALRSQTALMWAEVEGHTHVVPRLRRFVPDKHRAVATTRQRASVNTARPRDRREPAPAVSRRGPYGRRARFVFRQGPRPGRTAPPCHKRALR